MVEYKALTTSTIVSRILALVEDNKQIRMWFDRTEYETGCPDVIGIDRDGELIGAGDRRLDPEYAEYEEDFAQRIGAVEL